MKWQFNSFAQTDLGLVREGNEDSALSCANLIAVNIEIIRSDHSFVLNQMRKGKQVIVWTVNDENDLKLCQDLGVKAVITDYPARVRKILGYP